MGKKTDASLNVNINTITYTLTTSVFPSGSGTINIVPLQDTYAPGTLVTLTATPNTGYLFYEWSDNDTNAVKEITMNDNVSIMAFFILEPVAQTLLVLPISDHTAEHTKYPSSTAHNYLCVDEGETPNNDTDYVYQSLNGVGDSFKYDRYNMQTVSGLTGTITSVQVVVHAKKLGAGNAAMHIGYGNSYNAPDDGDMLTTSYAKYIKTYLTQTNGSDWTWAAVQNLRLNIETYLWNESNTSATARVTSAYILINYEE